MSILITPRATEKAYRLATAQNTYVFNVPMSANKQQIAEAVEAEFGDVSVGKVSVAVQSGKAVRYSRGKRSYPGTTHRQDTKKAYVTLSKGSIKLFEETEQKEEKK
ncbi:50S ribosomal protein L23 [Candidatus Nomurabacteria bacterium]|nr:50S ribosomal protein L23 [Candidatus Nomurabacteria bacterium]